MLNKVFVVLTALSLSFFMALPEAHATVFSSSQPTLQIGGRVFTDLTNLKILAGSAGSAKFATLRDVSTGAAYQVASGKTFKVLAVKGVASSATAIEANICYGDSDVGQNAVSGPTNIVYQNGYSGIGSLAGTTPFTIETNFSVPALKYPCFNMATATSGSVYVYGYEQ